MSKENKTVRSIDEKKTAASSYFLQLYQSVDQLNHYFALYINILIKHEALPIDLSDEDEAEINNSCQSIRYLATKIYVQYLTILKDTNGQDNLKTHYKALRNKDNYILKEATLREFVIEINHFVTQNSIKTILESNKDYLDKLFKNE